LTTFSDDVDDVDDGDITHLQNSRETATLAGTDANLKCLTQQERNRPHGALRFVSMGFGYWQMSLG
jgi:hypothetical protein